MCGLKQVSLEYEGEKGTYKSSCFLGSLSGRYEDMTDLVGMDQV
jgi:hypothetical protein